MSTEASKKEANQDSPSSLQQKFNDRNRLLKKLFRPGEFICVGDSDRATGVYKLEDVLESEWLPTFFSINPLDGERDRRPEKEWHKELVPRRADHNVTAYRNLLLEFDKESLEDQLQILVDRRVPYSTLTFSGGKSVHAIISLEDGFASEEEYKAAFKLINYVLWQVDPSAKNPSRFSRCAGAMRGDVEQALLEVRRTQVTKEKLFDWLARFASHIERCQAREAARLEELRSRKQEGEGLAAIREDTWLFLSGELQTRGSRHNRLYAAACEFRDNGVEFDVALEWIRRGADASGVSSEPGRGDEADKVVRDAYGYR